MYATWPNEDACTAARAILTNPTLCASRPQLRMLAWAALKTQRNQAISQITLGQMRQS